MPHLLAYLIRLIASKALQFALILVVLVAGAWLVNEVTVLAREEVRLAQLKASVGSNELARAEAQRAMAELAGRRKEIARPLGEKLAREKSALEALEAEYRKLWEAHPLDRKRPSTDVYRDLISRYAVKESRKLAVQALEQSYRFALGLEPLGATCGDAERARQQEAGLARQVQENRRRRQAILDENPYRAPFDPFLQKDLEDLDNEYEALKPPLARAKACGSMLAQLPAVEDFIRKEAEARKAHDAAARAAAEAGASIGEMEARLADSTVRWIRDNVIDSARKVFWTAVILFVGIIATPYLIKALFFFVLAPAAARRPPFRISESDSGVVLARQPEGMSMGEHPPQSAVSIELTLRAGEALIARSDYIQSASVSARRSTRWLLDRRRILTSLASGLSSLEQVEGEGATVVVSSVDNALMEVALIELPEGSAMVFKPRCLVGVVCPADRPPRITSAWRILSLHAWLTLQFRYLVFHGPVCLIAKGCRGIRVERPGEGRAISQAATLGFSAGLRYANARSGPFVAYVKGERALFEDRFAGEAGCFAYEEVPSSGKAGGASGKGLEGFTDAALKVLGV